MSGCISPHPGRIGVTCTLLALCAFALACKTPYEQAYRRSYEEHNARTIANPEAGAGDLEAPRPDGASTDAAVYKVRTHETQVDEGEPPTVINIDSGS